MKRLKIDGKSQTKNDLMYLIGQIKPCDPFAIYDYYAYREYVERLKSICERYYTAAARYINSPTAVINTAHNWLNIN